MAIACNSLVLRPSLLLSFAVEILEAGKQEKNSCLQNCYCKRKQERRPENEAIACNVLTGSSCFVWVGDLSEKVVTTAAHCNGLSRIFVYIAIGHHACITSANSSPDYWALSIPHRDSHVFPLHSAVLG